jgi:TRAP-type C4-dicarboxylate transport system permease small subunit
MSRKHLRIFGFNLKANDILIIVSLLLIIFLIIPNLIALAQFEELEKVAEETNLKGETDISLIVGRIIRIILGFLGLILVILILYAGFLWMTSGGNEEKIKKARQIISTAITGLAIVVLSYAIANFILQRLVEIGR